ncbi:ATP-binding protein [Candidatus Cyanaurora vandensis]|uniref:PAS domain-containing hybrid sensor histidine kinase/response regulator n=1 Tax=Candidatus Cyanaurora vandensis TaxID=2714958 RepID=UPI00257CEE9F|nr:ATP-binding protein [Candidatus Cyanaurora vandensis]
MAGVTRRSGCWRGPKRRNPLTQQTWQLLNQQAKQLGLSGEGLIQQLLRGASNLPEQTDYPRFLYHLPALFAVVRGLEQRFVFANLLYLQTSGRTPDTIGRTLSEVFPELADQPYFTMLNRVYCMGETCHQEEALVRWERGGQQVEAYFNFMFSPFTDEQGQIQGVLIQGVEVTVQVQARQQAEEAQQHFRELAETLAQQEARQRFLAAASTVLTASLDYTKTLANLAQLTVPFLADICLIHMVTEDNEIKQVAAVSIHRQPELLSQQEPFHQLIGEAIATKEARFVPQTPKALRPVQSYIITPLVARGSALGVITLLTTGQRVYDQLDFDLAQDLARRIASNLDNVRLYRKAQEANRVKDEFLATVSHELRTPLNAILGWTQILRRSKLDFTAQERALATIERNARAQNQLIEDILDVSRIITGKLKLQRQLLSLVAVIEGALASVQLSADNKGIHLVTALDAIGQVLGDSNRLQQVVWNLLTNAIKFTPAGGEVLVQLETVDDEAVITVSDTGQGVAAEFLPYIFDRFRQADSSSTRHYGGLGLGLAIVRNLVELHGGRIYATSAGAGCGMTFTVHFPLAQTTVPAVRKVPPSSRPSQTLVGVRVLVVDDEPDARDLVGMVLEEAGAAVRTAGSVAQALEVIASWLPDLLLSDIAMPGEDGYILLQKIRAGGTDLPAVALTAHTRQEDRAHALAAGYQRHLPKPVEPLELLTVVTRLVGRA